MVKDLVSIANVEAWVKQSEKFFRQRLPAMMPVGSFVGQCIDLINGPQGKQLLPAFHNMTLQRALLTSATLGLSVDPQLQQAAITVYKEKGRPVAKLIIMYQGYIDLMYRTGQCKRVWGSVVKKNDKFALDVAQSVVREHTFELDEDRGHPIGAYACFESVHGGIVTVPVPLAKMHSIRDASPNYRRRVVLNWQDGRPVAWKKDEKGDFVFELNPTSLWHTDEDSMFLKSAYRLVAKVVPKSQDIRGQLLSRAVNLDEQHDRHAPQDLDNLPEVEIVAGGSPYTTESTSDPATNDKEGDRLREELLGSMDVVGSELFTKFVRQYHSRPMVNLSIENLRDLTQKMKRTDVKKQMDNWLAKQAEK